jgi:UDP-N-acetylmuramoyl-L-alanyl-D-glutamate--2,6-diaminopimelate ligase
MHRYIHAKNKIFHYSDIAILNKDDQSYKQISKNVTIPSKTYSIDTKSTYQATNIKINQDELTFKVNQTTFKTNSNYYYQIYNILAAYSVINTLNIDTDLFLSVIKDFPEVAGRRQSVPNKLNIKTIIDFAHTPAALESTLSSLKKLTKGNLIVIFGATGGRDKSKRPLMGAVVSQHANIAILTSDDTRNEKVEDINQQIAQGIKPNSEFFNYVKITSSKQFQKISLLAQNKFVYLDIPNRQDAFNYAIKLAQPGDTVIACGKGHETSILHGTTEYPWSESEAFRTAFRLKTQI